MSRLWPVCLIWLGFGCLCVMPVALVVDRFWLDLHSYRYVIVGAVLAGPFAMVGGMLWALALVNRKRRTGRAP